MELNELVTLLRKASDAYHNDQPIITDAEYDALEQELRAVDPTNPYLIEVGSDVRTGKEPLPEPMGSLTQIYADDESVPKFLCLVSDDDNLVLDAKLDGTSVMIQYGHSGELLKGYSRGNGFEGADVTRHLRKMKNLPQKISGTDVRIRAEVILKKDSQARIKASETAGREYKNNRNFVAGQMNSKEADQDFLNEVHVVGYQVLRPAGLGKSEQLSFLSSMGFEIPKQVRTRKKDVTVQVLTDLVNTLKTSYEYEVDGIVVNIDSADIRNKIPMNGINPGYAAKFKVTQEEDTAITTILDIEWNPSRYGYLKPRIRLEPVDILGVTVQYCTGNNARYVRDMQLGVGAVVRVQRAGDVIPQITEVLTPGEVQLPTDIAYFTEGEVDLVLKDADNDLVALDRLIYFVGKLEVKQLKSGSIERLFQQGIKNSIDLIKAPKSVFMEFLGQNSGAQAHDNLHSVLVDVQESVIAAASGSFDRGVGERVLQKVIDQLGEDWKNCTEHALIKLDGIGQNVAQKIIEGIPKFEQYLVEAGSLISVKTTGTQKFEGDLSGKVYGFTGIRDAGLKDALEKRGAEVIDGFRKDLTALIAKDPNGSSSKIKKATDLGIPVISVLDARKI